MKLISCIFLLLFSYQPQERMSGVAVVVIVKKLLSNLQLNSLFPRQAALSELKKKYRIWRANIPRNNLDDNIRVQRDRIRNPWAYIKLSSEDDVLTHNKTFLNDVLVNSTIM